MDAQTTIKRSGWAIVSLIFGLAALVLCFVTLDLALLLGGAGLGLGITSLVMIDKKRQTGKGFAFTGMILGVLAVAAFLFFGLAFPAITDHILKDFLGSEPYSYWLQGEWGLL